MTTMDELAKEIHDAQETLAAYVNQHPHDDVYGMPPTPAELRALKLIARCAVIPRKTWETLAASFEESRRLREHLRSFIGVH